MWITKLHPTLPIYETSALTDEVHLSYQGFVVVLTEEGRFLPLFPTYRRYDLMDELKKLQDEKEKGEPSMKQIALVTYIVRQHQERTSSK